MNAMQSTGAMRAIPVVGALLFAMAASVSCGAPPSEQGEEARAPLPAAMGPLDMSAVHEREEAAQSARPEPASIRRPFLGGYFETRNKEFPAEVEQAASGQRTDRAVIVLATPVPALKEGSREGSMSPRGPLDSSPLDRGGPRFR